MAQSSVLLRGSCLIVVASEGPCLSTRQVWARQTTHPRSDIRSKVHHAAAAYNSPKSSL